MWAVEAARRHGNTVTCDNDVREIAGTVAETVAAVAAVAAAAAAAAVAVAVAVVAAAVAAGGIQAEIPPLSRVVTRHMTTRSGATFGFG